MGLSAPARPFRRRTLRKKGPLTLEELEPVVKDLSAKLPFTSEQIAVTDPKAFLNSLLPYMIRQRLITEEKENGRTVYRYRK